MNCAICDKDDPRECAICQDHNMSENTQRLIEEIKKLKEENEVMRHKLEIINKLVKA